jgi:endonuclease/exonuclease/phosphatase family metal-dependent hydrolase
VTGIVWLSANLTSAPDLPTVLDSSPLPRPDVILLREATSFDRNGDEPLLSVERQLDRAGYGRYRGFLTPSGHSARHQVIFLNTLRLQAIHHWHDADESPGLRGFVEVIVDGDETQTVWLKSIQLDPRDGEGRLAEAKQLNAAVPVAQHVLLAGDFNTDVPDYLLDSGWICQHTASSDLKDHRGDRCLTTGGLVAVAQSVWVDTNRAMGGAVVCT